jgi:hypothetical protein
VPFFVVASIFAIATTLPETMYYGAAVNKLHALIHMNPEPEYSSPFRLKVKSLHQKLTQLSSNQSKMDPARG